MIITATTVSPATPCPCAPVSALHGSAACRRETMPPRDHYTQQLEALHAELRSLGQLVVAAITWSLGAFSHHDTKVAERVVTDDHDIDHAQYTLEEHAISV